jgi:replication factor A1
MKVKDLKADAKVDVLEITIKEKGETRDVNTFRGASRVCDAKGVDEDGDEVQISLWNDEIEKVNVNDVLRITNGWVRQWRGNMQVSAGRFGKLDIVTR